jgi:hypothetical protein
VCCMRVLKRRKRCAPGTLIVLCCVLIAPPPPLPLCAVTLVCQDVLPKESPEAREAVQRALALEGVQIEMGRLLTIGLSSSSGGVKTPPIGQNMHMATITVSNRSKSSSGIYGAKKERTINAPAEFILCALGRSAADILSQLQLSSAGVALNAKGNLVVDQYLCTNVRHIFACGDCAGGLQFTHLAGYQGSVCSWNACMPSLLWQKGPIDENVPRVTFTEPEVASVGLCVLEDAKGVYTDVIQTRVELKHVDRAVCEGKGEGSGEEGFMLLVHRGNAGTLVGASIVGDGAGELLSECALAIKNKITLTGIATTMHPYPTMAFGLQVAASNQMYDNLQNMVQGSVFSCFRTCFGPVLHGSNSDSK